MNGKHELEKLKCCSSATRDLHIKCSVAHILGNKYCFRNETIIQQFNRYRLMCAVQLFTLGIFVNIFTD